MANTISNLKKMLLYINKFHLLLHNTVFIQAFSQGIPSTLVRFQANHIHKTHQPARSKTSTITTSSSPVGHFSNSANIYPSTFSSPTTPTALSISHPLSPTP